MGTTTHSIKFFSDEITIRPHTATHLRDIDRPVSIREFAAGRPVSLEQIDSANNPAMIGEYIVRAFDWGGDIRGTWHRQDFIQGPEVTAS